MTTKPHIVIDARLYGPLHTGIGRYTKNLLLALTHQPHFSLYRFSLLVSSDQLPDIKKDLNSHYNYIPTRIRHYTLAEQLLLPFVIYSHLPNLVHFTHFNKPPLYFGLSVITIHDLIKHLFKGKDTTTRNHFLYWPKYLAYRLVTWLNIRLNPIIVPSHYWRNYLITNFKVNPKKITVTYEAVDPNFLKNTKVSPAHHDYLVYTGNLYPHKNLIVVLESLKRFTTLRLKIISARNTFWARMEKTIQANGLSGRVEFLGHLPDKQFRRVYRHALALVHPSLAEGFSLTGLEAMALNCPVISSNSTCLPEIYRDSVLYFDPTNPDQLSAQILHLQKNPQLRQSLIKKGHQLLSKYSWNKTAIETLNVYHSLLKKSKSV
ncbi:MAG: glycosyltransferase family 1 protein [Candidatus Shapirobacteria bacterium]